MWLSYVYMAVLSVYSLPVRELKIALCLTHRIANVTERNVCELQRWLCRPVCITVVFLFLKQKKTNATSLLNKYLCVIWKFLWRECACARIQALRCRDTWPIIDVWSRASLSWRHRLQSGLVTLFKCRTYIWLGLLTDSMHCSFQGIYIPPDVSVRVCVIIRRTGVCEKISNLER